MDRLTWETIRVYYNIRINYQRERCFYRKFEERVWNEKRRDLETTLEYILETNIWNK
jgi:hypothetical protein